MKKLLFLTLLPLLALSQKGDEDTREARFGILNNIATRFMPKPQGGAQPHGPFVYIQTVDPHTQASVMKTATNGCEMKGGKEVKEKCLKYIAGPANYADAVTNCEGMGGSLWVPDINDGNLWQHMFSHYKDLYKATSRDIYIGIKRTGGKYIGTDMKDYSWNPLVLAGHSLVKDCLTLRFDYGAFYLKGVPCTSTNDYVCHLKVEMTQTHYVKG